jgi:hypothetical protein
MKLFSRTRTYTPRIGDVIFVRRGFYRHAGVYVGSRPGDCRDVVHNDKAKGVLLSNLAIFSGGAGVGLHMPAAGNCFQKQAAANRALSLLGRKYDLWKFNCEHEAEAEVSFWPQMEH